MVLSALSSRVQQHRSNHARDVVEVAGIIAVAIILRALVFDKIGIWGDYGFYQYDARLILAGKTPFIDFLGRSPVVVYLYAGAVALFGHPIELVRGFMHFWWLLTALPVYGIARHVRDHRSAVVAVGFFLLFPFSLVYSSWAGTQTVAAFWGTTAVYLLVRYPLRPRVYAAAGMLLGVAYLSRRSMIVLLFAIGLYTVYHHVRYEWAGPGVFFRYTVSRGIAVTGAFLLTLFVIYGALAGYDLETTWALFEIHSLNLFLTYGRGGYPLLGVQAPLVTNSLGSGRVPIFNDLCQLCSVWTARTFAKTISVTVPVIGLLWFYLRDLETRYFTEANIQYLYGILAALGLYSAVMATLAGYPVRTGVTLCLALFAYIAHRVDVIDREILYNRDLQLVLVILCGLTAGYLYRRRVLHTYYFMDFWPYLSVLSGIVAVRAWQLANRHSRLLIAIAIIAGTVAAGLGAHPLTVVVIDDNDAGWFTMHNIHDYQQDINERTEPGDTVFAGNPTYVANTHARMPMDRPRIHMVGARYHDNGPAKRQYRILNGGMRNGSIEYVIYSRTTRDLLLWNETAGRIFKENYCRVPSADELYQRTGAFLYEWRGNAECPESQQPRLNTTLSGRSEVN